MHQRGLVYFNLERYEEAYLSFAKALSMPYYSQDSDPLFALTDSYCKMLLIQKLVSLHHGKSFENRSALQMPYLLHFTN